MYITKWLAPGLAINFGGMALAADPKPAAPTPEPRKILAGPELVEEIDTTLKAIFRYGKEPSPQQLYLLVGELLDLHTGRQPTPEEVTAMVADVKNFKPRPKPEFVLPEVGDLPAVELMPADDLGLHPVLRMSADQMKELLGSLKGAESDGHKRQPDLPFMPTAMSGVLGGVKDTQPGGFVGGFGGGSDRRGAGGVLGGFNPGGDLKGGIGIPQVRQPIRPPGR